MLRKLSYTNDKGELLSQEIILSLLTCCRELRTLYISGLNVSDRNWLNRLAFQLPYIERLEIGTFFTKFISTSGNEDNMPILFTQTDIKHMELNDSRACRNTNIEPVIKNSPQLSHLSLSNATSFHIALISSCCTQLKTLKLKLGREVTTQQIPIFRSRLKDAQIRPHPDSSLKDVIKIAIVFYRASEMIILRTVRFLQRAIDEAQLYRSQHMSNSTNDLPKKFILEQVPIIIRNKIRFQSDQEQSMFLNEYMCWINGVFNVNESHKNISDLDIPSSVIELIDFVRDVFEKKKRVSIML